MKSGGLAEVIALGGLVIFGAIIANIWANPKGTTAAANGLANLWTPSLRAVAGQQV